MATLPLLLLAIHDFWWGSQAENRFLFGVPCGGQYATKSDKKKGFFLLLQGRINVTDASIRVLRRKIFFAPLIWVFNLLRKNLAFCNKLIVCVLRLLKTVKIKSLFAKESHGTPVEKTFHEFFKSGSSHPKAALVPPAGYRGRACGQWL